MWKPGIRSIRLVMLVSLRELCELGMAARDADTPLSTHIRCNALLAARAKTSKTVVDIAMREVERGAALQCGPAELESSKQYAATALQREPWELESRAPTPEETADIARRASVIIADCFEIIKKHKEKKAAEVAATAATTTAEEAVTRQLGIEKSA